MADSYSVEAILSAVDKGFTKTMRDAEGSMGGLDDKSQKAGTSIMDIAKGAGVFKVIDGAINMVKDSLGGAINRFDTLNKYPVVMEALGYSADEVDNSMKKLNKGIDGLPTSLDEIVSSTQQLAISTGSLEKGTDTAIALNNAFLASGASTADASRGMEQYRQMLGRGEVDMQSWRSVQETMPVAMDKVAKSFREQGVGSVTELYDALKEGDITFDDFNSRLVELNEGVGGFADLAQKNSKGIATSWANIKTAVVKGVENVIRAIDEGLQGAGLGSIADNFDKMKEVINKAFSVIVKVIPPVIEFIAKLVETIKRFAPVLVPLVTAWGAFMIQLKGISTLIKVFNNVKAAISGVVGTLKILGAVAAANPLVLIIGAVVGAIAVFGYFMATNEEFREKVIGIWNSVKETVVGVLKGIKEWGTDTWNSAKDLAKGAADGVKNAWSGTKQWFSDLWTGIKDGTSGLWDNVKSGAKSAVKSVKDTWVNIKETVAPYVAIITEPFAPMIDWFSGLWDSIATVAGSGWEIIKSVIMGPVLLLIDLITGDFDQFKEDLFMIWDTIKTNALNIFNTIKDTVVGYVTALVDTVTNLWTTLKDVTTQKWTELKEWLKTTVENMVKDVITKWENLKTGTINKFNETISWAKETWQGFKTWLSDLIESTVKGAINWWETLKSDTVRKFNGLVDGAKQAWKDLTNSVTETVDKVKNIFERVKEIDLWEAGKAIMDSFFKGLQEKWENVKDFVGGIGDWIRDNKGPISYDKRLLIPAGKAIMSGLNNSLTEGFGLVKNNVNGMGNSLAEAFDSSLSMPALDGIDATMNQSMSHAINAESKLLVNNSKEPVQLNLHLGDRNFEAFVDDISNVQGAKVDLIMKF